MALADCSDCGAPVSSEARSCLRCGRPVRIEPSAARLIVTSIVLIFLLAAFVQTCGQLVSSS